MKEYNKKNIPLARALRKNMTPWERKLWYQYLCKYPIRFQRQKAIGDYIADFYCAKAKIVIELDGGGHYEEDQAKADALRTASLEAMKLRVIRICNTDIDHNFRGVCEYIDQTVRNSLPQSAALTAPSSAGACPHRTANRRIFALGFFDGVHLGHQALLTQCAALAREMDAETAAITFAQHPQSLFSQSVPPLLCSLSDRTRLLERYGMDRVFAFPVTQEVMSTDWQDFLAQLLQQGAVGFVCGDDFRFGHKGQGDAEKLQQFCGEQRLPCIIVPEQTMDNLRISSSHIRTLVEAGDVETAMSFLGHPHIFSGEVVSGRQLGRTIGVPTANILLPEGVVVPKFGVYATTAQIQGKVYPAVTNIGSRPTVGGHQVRSESWLLNFDGDLYGKVITLEFHKFLRPEQKFDSLQDLQAQIHRDAEQMRKILG
ncbi:MAG: bifunctional riboflavin kinase/FAD synthetase [Oscillospiraceae bacterium]|nr:bifunctional riboflavin kinase/FAD synthetase [Oscillospiraceae bacterium]